MNPVSVPTVSFHSNPRLVFAALASLLACTAPAAIIVKENNTTNLDQPESWVGATVPGSGDIAQWDATVLSAQTLDLGSDRNWLGVNIVTGLGGNVAVNAGSSLTLGSSGITNTANRTTTFNNAIILGADQTWTSSTGTVIAAGSFDMAGNDLTLRGTGGAIQLKSTITGAGDFFINHNNVKWSNGTNAVTAAVTINSGGVLIFDSNASTGGDARAASMTLNGGTLSVVASSGTNEFDQIAGPLNVSRGASTLKVAANVNRYAQLEASTFSRSAGGVVLFAGTNLGVNSLASETVGAANVKFGTAPTLSGGAGAAGSTTVSILAGAYGDATSAGNGFGATGGLVTYDASNGVRLLAGSEYKNTITDGQSQLDNVLLANSDGTGDAYTLNSATTVNSLSLNVSTTTGSGVTVSGPETLKLNSGVIYAVNSVASSGAADKMILDVAAIDMNGKEGIVLFSTTNQGAGHTGGGVLEINSKITNDGGNGITFSGAGTTALSGTSINDYTGVTTVNSGTLWLNKTGVDAIPGNVVINGGELLIANNNQIADTADIRINGGTLNLRASANSGSGRSENFRDLTMTGGTYNDGASGTSSGTTNVRNATLSGGQWNVTQGHKTALSGSLNLDGGVAAISRANDTSRTSVMTVNGSLTITNIATGAYTPVTLGGGTGANIKGGQLALLGDVTFVGNSTNSNTVTINATAPTNGGEFGTIGLNGVRTFTVGNGAASEDLTVVAGLVDDTAAGGLIKAGAGTLELSGVSTYTEATTVNAGTLLVSGSLSGSSPLTVKEGTLSGTGTVGTVLIGDGVGAAGSAILSPGRDGAIGTLSMGPLSLASDAAFKFELNSTTLTADVVNVSGALSLGSGVAALVGTDLLTATLLSGQFALATASGGVTGFFNGYAEGATFLLGANSYRISYGVEVPNAITLTAVPEPGAGTLLLGGLTAFATLRRRRSSGR